jgi:hypothetical protein
MSLSSISKLAILTQKLDPVDVGFRKFKARDRTDKSLNVQDIDGTKPYLKSYRYSNKPDFTNK